MNDLIEQASEMGRQAILSGKSSAPVNDLDLINLVKNNNEGKEFGWTIAIFDAWSDAFHAQILGGKL